MTKLTKTNKKANDQMFDFLLMEQLTDTLIMESLRIGKANFDQMSVEAIANLPQIVNLKEFLLTLIEGKILEAFNG